MHVKIYMRLFGNVGYQWISRPRWSIASMTTEIKRVEPFVLCAYSGVAICYPSPRAKYAGTRAKPFPSQGGGRPPGIGPCQVASAASPPRTHGGTAGGSSSPQPAARAAEAPPPGRPKAQEEEPQGQRQRTRQTNPSPVIALPQSKCQRRPQIQFLLPLPVRPNRAKGSQRAAPLV